MAGEFSRADQALTRGATFVQSAKSDLEGQLGTLRGQLEGIGSAWQGGASTAFQTTMTRWNEDARKIISALDEFEANLRSSDQTYSSTDDAQSATFNKFQGRL